MRKWAKDKQNASEVRQTNNQMFVVGLMHEQRCVCMIFEGAYVRSVPNFCSCRQFAKEAYNWK
jgi:hypothetical protein